MARAIYETNHIAIRDDRHDSEELQMGNFIFDIIKHGIKMIERETII